MRNKLKIVKDSGEIYGDVRSMILAEVIEIKEKIMRSNFVNQEKQERMIEKWGRLDDDCARRAIKVPFDA